MKEELRRLQKWLELGYIDGAQIGIKGGVRQIEEALLEQYRALRREDKSRKREDEVSCNTNRLASDMVSELSYLQSDRGISDMTGETQQERFHRKWEKIINSGMDKEDLTFLNPNASLMLPRTGNDPGLQTVKRLQKELGELQQRLPRRGYD